MWLNDLVKNSNHKTPIISLTVRPKDGGKKDISQLISHRLISLTLTDSRGFEADQLDLTLDDSDGLLDLPPRAAVLSLGFGWKSESIVYKGEYTVDEVEHSGSPDIVTIRARSADMRGSLLEHKERSFHKKTIKKIVEQIAGENKLTPMVGKSFSNQIIEHIDQSGESSINLLSRMAKEYDAIATVKNGNLLFIETGQGKTASGQVLPEIYITRNQGDQHRYAIAEGENYKAVRAYYHDIKTGKREQVYFDANTKIEKTRKSQKLKQTKPAITDSDNIKTIRHTYKSKQAAKNAVIREFKKLGRGTATFSLSLAQGNPELMPELPVKVVGFKKEIDVNKWIIRQVTHNISADSGYTTGIECELKGE
ncbi:Phage protein D [Phocoenobacter uteri]|uniref:Phage protein D n=2 Tax=Phocoenobacter uteri TaxID=146806 RepID=A0A379CBI1_9PAST|nr:phage tail protein [Phocoenobacter uteri]SUB59085.1 Phage protein D [Phocoenobacter uteri]